MADDFWQARKTENTDPCTNYAVIYATAHAPSTAGTFRKKVRKNAGKTPETLSELFLEFPSRV